MKYNIYLILFLIFINTFSSCKEPQARKPISRSSGTFMKESIVRNKNLVAGEERKID